MTGNICVYCPGGPDSDFDYSTQSYTGYEPTSMRAIRARYDPYEQTRGRVEQLKSLGHSVDKVEFIIMGGTFMSMPEDYRSKFVAQLHNALSGFTGFDIDEAVRWATFGIFSAWARSHCWSILGTQSRASRKLLALRSKLDRIIAYDPTFPKCYVTAVLD